MVVAAEAFFRHLNMETSPQPERRFAQRGLPWLIAVAGLLTYLATLNPWLTLNSLPVAAEVNGWFWRPMLFQPVLFLLTWPLRWLPGSGAPLALNLFTAVCASLTLALLARSVALLPQDRLEQQRLLVQNEHGLLSLPSAWVPPALAAVALGLQLTFWENATAASGEMLDLLLFACPIWCLLEYRLEQRRCWLDRTALLCGVALANSWAIIGFLPLFCVALLRSKELRFFKLRFLRRAELSDWKAAAPALRSDLRFFLRMALFGLAGLLLFLLLPLVQALLPDSPLSFWQALRTVAASYKATLQLLADRVFLRHRDVALLLTAVSLAPLLLLSIRWKAFTGRQSRRLDLVSFIFYATHAFLLLLCVYVAFDPPVSPRQLGQKLGLSLPFLTLYYLGALSIGYYSGFFLLIFSGQLGRHRMLPRALRWTPSKVVYALLGLTLTGLLGKNAPTIRLTNGRQLEQYARLVVDSLPLDGAVVCSHDSTRLALLRAALAREGKAGRYVPVDATALASERYRAWLRRNYPRQWTELEVAAMPPAPGGSASQTNAPLDAAGYLRLVARVAQSNRVCYLQPDFGYLAEQFHFQPRGLVYELKPYPTNGFSGALLTAAELAENEGFWKRATETGVDPLARSIADAEHPRPGLAQRLMEWAHVPRPLPGSVRVLALCYSSALNWWGVALQRHERWRAATPCFAKARELNPDNLAAQVNLQCNSNRLAGQGLALVRPKSVEEQLGKYRNWNQMLTADGPFDEPNYCYQLSLACAKGMLWRQAGQQLERVQALAPKEIYARLVLGDLLNRCRMADPALQVAAEIQADPSLQPLDAKVQVELAFLEAGAWLVKTNPAKAQGIVQSLLDSHPGDTLLLDRTKAVFAAHGSYSNALRIADQQLQDAPDNVRVLLEKGLLYLAAGEFLNALQPLTRALLLTNSYGGRINRGLAFVHLDRLDAAEADYQEALRTFPTSYQPYYGLAEVARRKGDTNAAIRHYQQYLSKAPTNSGEVKAVEARLKELQPGAP